MIEKCPALEWTWLEQSQFRDKQGHFPMVRKYEQVHGSMKRPLRVPKKAKTQRCDAPLKAEVTIVVEGVAYDPSTQSFEGGEEKENIIELRCIYGHLLNSLTMKPGG